MGEEGGVKGRIYIPGQDDEKPRPPVKPSIFILDVCPPIYALVGDDGSGQQTSVRIGRTADDLRALAERLLVLADERDKHEKP